MGTRGLGCLLLLPLGLLWAGCPPSTVIIEGREVPKAEGEKLSFQSAQRDAEAGKQNEAAQKFRDFIKEFPDSNLIDGALAALGDLENRLGRLEKALENFRRLVTDFPQSPHYLNATVQVGLILMKLGRAEEALPTLRSVFDHLPDARKKIEVAGMLSRSYLSAGAPVEALRWFAVLRNLSGDTLAKTELQDQLLDLIDHQMSFVQVREALEVLKDAGVKDFPLDALQFKLAKIFYHIHDFENARITLETFAAAFPNHPYSEATGKLLKRILDRHQVNPLVIGVLLPLSGEYREYGQQALQGLQLGTGVLDDDADAGKKPLSEGVEKGKGDGPILVIRDSAGNPEKAAAQVEDLVFNEHAIAIVGPLFSKESHAAAVKADELEIPIVTLSGLEDITQLGSYVFRNFLTRSAESRLLVAYAMEKLGLKRFAILYPNDQHGVGMANAFWDEVSRRQGEIRAAESYEPDIKNFADPIKKMVGRYYIEARGDFYAEYLKAKTNAKTPTAKRHAYEQTIKKLPPIVDFEALFVPDMGEPLGMIPSELAYWDVVLWTDNPVQISRIKKSLGRKDLDMIYLLGGDGWNDPRVIQWASRYVQGALFCDGFFSKSSRPATQAFVTKFMASFDREPTTIEAESFDTGKMMKELLAKERPQNRRALRDSLLRVKNFEGATGTTSIGSNREAEKNLFLLTIKKDEILEMEQETPADANRG